jgi:hypothetical protein
MVGVARRVKWSRNAARTEGPAEVEDARAMGTGTMTAAAMIEDGTVDARMTAAATIGALNVPPRSDPSW